MAASTSDGAPVRTTAARRLRIALESGRALEVPGVHDGFSARAAAILGFEAVYVAGGIGVAANLGIPDMGMVTTDEILEFARLIAATTDLPVIADLDDGGGSPIRVRRTVQQAERAGLAGFHIEDGEYSNGKHFPPRNEGEVLDYSRDLPIEVERAVERVRAAVEARTDPDTVIVARTDAALRSVDEAIERGRIYAEAGADLVFVTHVAGGDMARIADGVPVPLMATSAIPTGATQEERCQMLDAGVRILITPGGASLPAYAAEWAALEQMRETGIPPASYAELAPKLSAVVRHQDWAEHARRYRMI